MVKIIYKDTYNEITYEADNVDVLKDLIEIAKASVIPPVIEDKTFSCSDVVGTIPAGVNKIRTPHYQSCL